MDRFFTQIWKDKSTRRYIFQNIFWIILNAFFSVLCALITQNIIVTVLYITGIAIIDILVKICKFIHWEKLFDSFAVDRKKNIILLVFFLVFAFLPTVCMRNTEEISGLGIKILFVNFVPNCFGAFIVYSIIEHILKFDYQQIAYALIQKIKNILNILVRLVFLGSCLNAANYTINDEWIYSNLINKIYLFIIIFCGALALISFIIRIVDKEPFCFTAKQVYPTKTFVVVLLFLVSCGFAPLILGIGKHEPILLCINTLTAITIALFLFVFITRKTEKNSDEYPFTSLVLFILLAVSNCAMNLIMMKEIGDIGKQLLSGIVIFVFALVSLLFINKIQKSKRK